MAVTAFWYAEAFINILDEEVDWTADTIKVILTTSTYTPNQDTHGYHEDITNECAATGNYSTGGATLGTPTIGSTNNVVKLDGDDTTWAASTITAAFAVIYDSTPGASATNPLLFWVDFDGDESSSSGEFKITWHGSGMATITPADATGFPA